LNKNNNNKKNNNNATKKTHIKKRKGMKISYFYGMLSVG